MLARVYSCASAGSGMPGLCSIGRPDPAIHESQERARAASRIAGARCPNALVADGLPLREVHVAAVSPYRRETVLQEARPTAIGSDTCVVYRG